MYPTDAAARAATIARHTGPVATFAALRDLDVPAGHVAHHVRAGRWQRVGRAVVTHNGPLPPADRHAVCLANCGPRSLLTAFTALELAGLTNWQRDAVHVLVPVGTDVRRIEQVPVVLHRVSDWEATRRLPSVRQHAASDAAVVAAASLRDERSAVGLLAAVVQQRVARVADIRRAVEKTPNLRHRRALLFALEDFAMGAQALSEIDFGRLCRRAGLAAPDRQAVRIEPSGRRRYLDAQWRRLDGRTVAVEVDGAVHLRAERWWADMSRQNEVALTDTLLLRFPAPVVRAGDPVVADQLRRAGVPRRHR